MKTTEKEILIRFSLAEKKLKDYEPHLKPYFPNKLDRLEQCRVVALLFELLDKLKQEYKSDDIIVAWGLFADDVAKPRLSSSSVLDNLTHKIRTAALIKGGLLEAIIDYLKPKPRGNGGGKTPVPMIRLIHSFYAHANLNYEKITDQVNAAINRDVTDIGVGRTIVKYQLNNTEKQAAKLLSGKFIKASTVKKYIDASAKNILMELRHGKKAGRLNEIPLRRINALHALDRVEFDSTVFSFIHSDTKGKPSIKLYTSLVLDCYSNRIIGYAFGTAESSKLALTSFKNAFNTMGMLPAEIYTDRFPGYDNEELKYFKDKLEKLNCKFWFDRTGNPRSKGKVEKAIDIICELAMQYPNFIGKNITTKRRTSRKPVEVIARMTRVRNMESLSFVKGQIVELLALYNSLVGVGEKLPRCHKFNNSEKPNAITLTLEDKVWLFHKTDVKKVEQGGLIIFHKGSYHDHLQYEITDYKVRLYNGSKVRVRYTDEALEKGEEIYLFDVTTDESLCTCLPKRKSHLAIVNQNENDLEIIRDHIEDKKEYRKFVREKQTDIGYSPVEILNHMNATKLEVLNAEELYTLRHMTRDELDSELIPIKVDNEVKLEGKYQSSINPLNRRPNYTPRLDDNGNSIKPLMRIGEEWDKSLPLGWQDDPSLLADENEPGCEPV